MAPTANTSLVATTAVGGSAGQQRRHRRLRAASEIGA